MPREPRGGYEEEYRRGGVPSRRVAEEPIGRDDRHRSDRGEARERTRIVDEPSRPERPIRAERERDRSDRDDRMDYAVDPRVGAARGDPRANTAVRREERETITAYRDPRTGQLRDARTHELIEPSGRPATRPRDDYDDRMMMDREDPPPPRRRDREREREVYDPRGTAPRDDYDDYGRGAARQQGYGMNEYFVDGTGIEREVIQHDICRYLGNDATVRKYLNKDGREGYVVRAYRALTSAQLEDLRQDSSKYRRQQRSGRGAGTTALLTLGFDLTFADTYAEMRARDEPGYVDSMDVDMDYDPLPSRDRHRGEPEARAERADRHRLTPVTSGYGGEPSYPAYALGTGQGAYGTAQMPRTSGNYSPQGGRPTQGQYPTTSYDSRTSGAPLASIPTTQVYKDPKTGQLVPIDPGYTGGFAPEPTARGSGRHGR